MSVDIKFGNANLVIHEKINRLIKEKELEISIRKADFDLYKKKVLQARELVMKEFGIEVNLNQQGENLMLTNLTKARQQLKIVEDLKKELLKENCF